MKANVLLIASILILSTSMFVPAGAKHNERSLDPLDEPEMHPIGFHRGVLPTPADGEDLAELYEEVSGYNRFVPVWGRPTPFWNLSADLGGTWGDLFVDDLIRGNGMFPLVHMSFIDEGLTLAVPPWLPNGSLADPVWRGAYRKAALDIVNVSRPAYLSLGNEVNRWYERYGNDPSDPDGFQHWITLYESIYSEVKALSPNTTVFCTFAREVVSDNREADMSAVSMFDTDKLDMIVLTSYPHSVAGINRVSDIPDDYYGRVMVGLGDKPFGLSEVAWPSYAAFGGEAGQNSFIANLTSRLTAEQDIDVDLLGWAWLTDLSPDDGTGLRYLNGTAKSSLEAWKMNSRPYYDPDNRYIAVPEDFGTFTYDLRQTFKDRDPWDTLRFEVRNETGIWSLERNSTLLKSRINGTSLELFSMPDMVGSIQLMIRAIDHDGLWTWTLVQVDVLEVNDGPRLYIPFGTIPLLEDHTSYIQVSYHITDPDDDFEELEMEVFLSPDLATEVAGPYLKVYPRLSDWFGATWVLLDLTDPDGASLRTNISFDVVPINDPPVLTIPEEVHIEEDGSYSLDLSAVWTDVDSPSVTWDISVLSGAVNILRNGTDLTLVPDADWYGSALVRLDASDGEANDTVIMDLIVEEVNDVPRFDPPEPIVMDEDSVLYHDLSDHNAFDPEGSPVSWSVVDVPSLFRSVSILANGTMRIAPNTDDHGEANITAVLSDMEDGSVTVEFPVTVRSVNDPPFFSIREGISFILKEGENLTIDLEEQPFTLYDVENPNSELIPFIDDSNARIEGLDLIVSAPLGIAADSLSISVRFEDPEGGASGTVTILIEIDHLDTSERYSLNITGVEYGSEGGTFTIIARGAPYQTVWVVLSDGTSYKMTETPPGNGKYFLGIDVSGWENGTIVRFHLSDRDSGKSETQWGNFEFTYIKEKATPEEGIDPVLIIMAIGLIIALIVVLALFWIVGKRSKTRGPDHFPSASEE